MAEMAALGLAANIIQLISFSADLISKGHEIYKSADGTLVEHLELLAITEHFQELTAELSDGRRKLRPRFKRRPDAKAEKQLEDLCEGCKEATRPLIDVLERLKADGKHKRWNSFRQALNSVWSQEDIQALSRRLETFRRQIDTTLLVIIR
jgi:hypothetical protein